LYHLRYIAYLSHYFLKIFILLSSTKAVVLTFLIYFHAILLALIATFDLFVLKNPKKLIEVCSAGDNSSAPFEEETSTCLKFD